MHLARLVKRLRRQRTLLWQWYLAAGAIVTALYVFVPPFKSSGPVINLLGLSGVVAVVVGLRRNRPVSRLPWLLFAIGMCLFWLGDVYTYSYPRLFHVVVPFPSFGDALYLAVYPVLMAGLLLLVRRRNPERDRAAPGLGSPAETFGHPVIKAQEQKNVPLAFQAGGLFVQNLFYFTERAGIVMRDAETSMAQADLPTHMLAIRRFGGQRTHKISVGSDAGRTTPIHRRRCFPRGARRSEI